MRYENLCVKCMKEKNSADEICPHCGFDSSTYQAPEYYLPLYTVLSDNRYIIGKSIGTGGFGITYIAFDTRLNVPVAIKELFVASKVRRENGRTVLMNTTENGIRQYEELKRRFMQEARTMAELENIDGIVKVKDYFQQNDTAYIVMEYLDGMTLKKMLEIKKERIPLETVMTLLKPVMDSLDKMHKAGIVHRDISLDNIMITKDGRVKLIDLGGEKRLGDFGDEDKTVAIKKNVYTPIEQILGKSSNIGPWTDIYALAVTIYRCICGKFPKEAGDRESDKDIEKPSRLGVNITKKQEETLLKALAIDKKDRIHSIEQLQSGLSKEKKKSKAPAVIAALAIAAAGGGGYLFLQSQQTVATLWGKTKKFELIVEGGTGSGKYKAGSRVKIVPDSSNGEEKGVLEFYMDPSSFEVEYNFTSLDDDEYEITMPEQNVKIEIKELQAEEMVDRANTFLENEQYEDAVKLYQVAAEQKNAEALYHLADCYYSAYGVEVDKEKSFELTRESAELGYADAQYQLGYFYESGDDGFTQDYEEAVKWYKKAADQNYADAQCNLAYCYMLGYGGDVDVKEVAELFRKAAEQKNPIAEYYLGWCYENGYGLDTDFEQALYWYKEAADQGMGVADDAAKEVEKAMMQTGEAADG